MWHRYTAHGGGAKGGELMTVKRLGNGWYDFASLPQGGRYIKIHALHCGTDRKAINQARKILRDRKAKIVITPA
jgi:hypothetical protein